MDKGKVVRLILIPVLIGLAATLFVRQLLNTGSKTPAAPPVEMVSVVAVGKAAIPPRTKVTESQLVLKQLPKAALGGTEFTSMKDVVGQTSQIELEPGEVILPNRLVPDGKGSLPFRIPAGTRAVTIRIDELNGVAGYPQPGDLVDLVLVLAAKLPDRPLASSRLLYEAVPVLGQGPAAAGGKSGSGDSAKITSLTLALSPAAAVEVAMAEQIGVIKVLLRPALPEPKNGQFVTSESMYR